MRSIRRPKANSARRGKFQLVDADQDDGLRVVDLDGRVRHYVPDEITRALRYALARMQTSEKGEVQSRIAITSALSGEGVTFVARSLAALLANDLQRSVCVVDLNWWSMPAVKSQDRVDRPLRGVAQVIDAKLALDEALVWMQGWRLSLLPAGPASPAERPVLAKAAALVRMLDEVQQRFDHVVLDVPPVLGTGEAITLASLAEAFILVVRQGVTAEVQVQSALDELRHLTALGVVLNRASSHVPRRLVHLLAE